MTYPYFKNRLYKDATWYSFGFQMVHIFEYRSFLNILRCNHILFEIKSCKYLLLECLWKVTNFPKLTWER